MKKLIFVCKGLSCIIPSLLKGKRFVFFSDEGEFIATSEFKADNAFWRAIDRIVDEKMWE